jgi:hypothetical protein
MGLQGGQMKDRKERCAVDWSPEFTVTVREDHVRDGGTDCFWVKSIFYLVAEDKKGHRWTSPARHKELASAKSERRHLAREFNPTKAGWLEADPCYGSEAWTPEVEARMAYEEREADRWSSDDWRNG